MTVIPTKCAIHNQDILLRVTEENDHPVITHIQCELYEKGCNFYKNEDPKPCCYTKGFDEIKRKTTIYHCNEVGAKPESKDTHSETEDYPADPLE